MQWLFGREFLELQVEVKSLRDELATCRQELLRRQKIVDDQFEDLKKADRRIEKVFSTVLEGLLPRRGAE